MQSLLELAKWSGMRMDDGMGACGSGCGVLSADREAVFSYDFATDWRQWECVAFDVRLPDERPVQLDINVYPLVVGRPEYIGKTTAAIMVSGPGWHRVEICFDQFDYLHMTGAFWRFVSKIGIKASFLSGEPAGDLNVERIRLKHKGAIHLDSPVLSKPGKAGETVRYEVTVCNESDARQAIAFSLERYGWESMEATVEPGRMLLEPGESRTLELQVTIGDNVACGGYELQKLRAVPGGDANNAKALEFYTVRELPGPYILHTESGWNEVRENVRKYAWAQEALERHVTIADNWIVPDVHGTEYVFDLNECHRCLSAVIAWKLTGRIEFLDKAVLLLRRFADPETGYPATRSPVFTILNSPAEKERECPTDVKACSGVLVHEGGFFMDITAVYDLMRDAGVLTEEDHRRIRHTFALFIRKADWAITDGDCNNIPGGAMAGALLCSLALQDMRWIKRFIEGHGGFLDMAATGIMDDGWYFEGATNYVLLAAELFAKVSQACLPWGINLKDMYIPPSYRKNAMLSPWSMPREKPFLGMSFEKWGPNRRNYRSLRDLWDGLLPFVDYRGVIFGVSDSHEKLAAELYELAYYQYRDPAYVSAIRTLKQRDLLYGVGELPEAEHKPYIASAFADNVGLAVLRSQTEGQRDEDRIQAVLRYGTHGGYHGHFDRAGLMSIMRYGKSVYNPFATFYGYFNFMFKMWTQTSLAHNMVVVDERMQEPVESKRLMFHTGSMLQACAVETNARWCDPPYGGQTPYPQSFPEEKCRQEARELPIPAEAREKGDIGDYSEPVLQRRLMLVTDDYIVVADYLKGEQEHVFDCMYHLQGFRGLHASRLAFNRHTGQLNQDPYGAGQFITDCSWYECESPSVLHFAHRFDGTVDNSSGRRSAYNEDGIMKVDIHAVWPPKSEVVVGTFPEADEVNKWLSYELKADGRIADSGAFGAWILGQRTIDVSVEGVRELELRVSVDGARRKTVFLGNPCIVTGDGKRIPLADLPVEYENVDQGNGAGVDYYGGPVKIVGVTYDQAVPFEPDNTRLPAVAKVILEGLRASRFTAVIGGDYPLGDEEAQRKSVSLRTLGTEARYMTVIELYEDKPVIASAKAMDADCIQVRLTDGRVQEIAMPNLDGDGSRISVSIKETLDGTVIRQESAGPLS